MEIFASRCASFNSVLKTFIFLISGTWYCSIYQSVLHDLFLRAGSSTCSFDLKKKNKPNKPTPSKYFNQMEFPLALDTFCVPTPWVWRTRCKMPTDAPKRSHRQQWQTTLWPPSFSRAPAKTVIFTNCCNSSLGADNGIWIFSTRFPDYIISRFYKLWGINTMDQVYNWWIECESICESNPYDRFFLLLYFSLSSIIPWFYLLIQALELK